MGRTREAELETPALPFPEFEALLAAFVSEARKQGWVVWAEGKDVHGAAEYTIECYGRDS